MNILEHKRGLLEKMPYPIHPIQIVVLDKVCEDVANGLCSGIDEKFRIPYLFVSKLSIIQEDIMSVFRENKKTIMIWRYEEKDYLICVQSEFLIYPTTLLMNVLSS